jgi:hypothetical protein
MNTAITPQRPQLMPLSQLARQLCVPVRWLRDEADAGRIPCLRAGRTLLFDAEHVERLLAERARQGEGATHAN